MENGSNTMRRQFFLEFIKTLLNFCLRTYPSMADDTLSVLSEWSPSLTIDQLGGKLMKTQDHLKKALSRIVELEQKEVKNSERINQMELKLAIVLSKLDQLENQVPEEEDTDSLDEKWERTDKNDKAEKEDSQPEGSKPPGASSNYQSRTKLTDVIVQDHPGGRSGGHQDPDTEDNLEPDNQHFLK